MKRIGQDWPVRKTSVTTRRPLDWVTRNYKNAVKRIGQDWPVRKTSVTTRRPLDWVRLDLNLQFG